MIFLIIKRLEKQERKKARTSVKIDHLSKNFSIIQTKHGKNLQNLQIQNKLFTNKRDTQHMMNIDIGNYEGPQKQRKLNINTNCC